MNVYVIMDITFTSGNKAIIKHIVTYFINAKITYKNVNHHVSVIRNKYTNISTRVVCKEADKKGNQLKMKIIIET